MLNNHRYLKYIKNLVYKQQFTLTPGVPGRPPTTWGIITLDIFLLTPPCEFCGRNAFTFSICTFAGKIVWGELLLTTPCAICFETVITLDGTKGWLDDTCPVNVMVETGGELCWSCCCVDLITTAVPVPVKKSCKATKYCELSNLICFLQ